MRMILRIVLMLVIVAVAAVLVLRRFEPRLIFFPAKFPDGYWDTSQFPELQIEECWFTAEDGVRLHGWFAPAQLTEPQSAAAPIPTLLFCHGNAGNLSGRVMNVAALVRLGINVFIFDYRGYGKSEGEPTEQGVYRDAMAAYDYLVARDDVQRKHLVLFGRSLGGAVAVDLATKRPCSRLILEATFTSAADMARGAFGPFPIHYVLKTRFDSLSKIRDIRVPLLCIHGTQDTVVPFALGQRLFEAAHEPKTFYPIPGADHHNTYEVAGPAYFGKLTRFLQTAESS